MYQNYREVPSGNKWKRVNGFNQLGSPIGITYTAIG